MTKNKQQTTNKQTTNTSTTLSASNQQPTTKIIGVMGPGQGATPTDIDYAYKLGELIAKQGWILLTGGRNMGVMDAASRGAKAAGGLTIGILPGNNTTGQSPAVDIPIVTDLGHGRNNLNVLTSDAIIACGMGLGTASEVALALKNGKQVVLLTGAPQNGSLRDRLAQDFFTHLSPHNVFIANNPQEAINQLIAPSGEFKIQNSKFKI